MKTLKRILAGMTAAAALLGNNCWAAPADGYQGYGYVMKNGSFVSQYAGSWQGGRFVFSDDTYATGIWYIGNGYGQPTARFFSSEGWLYTGWQSFDDDDNIVSYASSRQRYLSEDDGHMLTGYFTWLSYQYYAGEDGLIYKNRYAPDGRWADSNGVLGSQQSNDCRDCRDDSSRTPPPDNRYGNWEADCKYKEYDYDDWASEDWSYCCEGYLNISTSSSTTGFKETYDSWEGKNTAQIFSNGYKWWYFQTSGYVLTDYCYVKNGKKQTGLVTVGSNKQYYFSSSGRLQIGWISYNGHKMFANPDDGSIVKNQSIALTDSKGKNEKFYRFNSNGYLTGVY